MVSPDGQTFSQTVSEQVQQAGVQAWFRITVTSNGGDAKGVTLTDNTQGPVQMGMMSGDANGNFSNQIMLGDIANGSSKTILIQSVISQASSPVTNTACASATNASQVCSSAFVIITVAFKPPEITPCPDL